MALIELSVITSMILEMGVDAAKKNLGRRETVISILKRLNLEVAPAADDFGAIYVYTLVEYGVDKPESILNFFRNEFIQKAFHKSFNENNPSILEKEAEGIILCPLASKNFKNFSRIWSDVIYFSFYSLSKAFLAH